MKNSQVAVVCGSRFCWSADCRGHECVAGALRCPQAAAREAPAQRNRHRPVIAMMPKAKGDPYFVSCRAGAEEAAKNWASI